MTLLTVADVREHITTELSDEALQLLLDAAEIAIIDVAGVVGEVTEIRDGGGTYVFLTRRAFEVGEIVESWDSTTRTLADGDFLLRGGVSLQRLYTGTTPSDTWASRVTITYTPEDDVAERKRVQLDLLRLDLTYKPGVTLETIGPWTEQYAANSVWNYALEREAILGTLRGPVLGFA